MNYLLKLFKNKMKPMHMHANYTRKQHLLSKEIATRAVDALHSSTTDATSLNPIGSNENLHSTRTPRSRIGLLARLRATFARHKENKTRHKENQKLQADAKLAFSQKVDRFVEEQSALHTQLNAILLKDVDQKSALVESVPSEKESKQHYKMLMVGDGDVSRAAQRLCIKKRLRVLQKEVQSAAAKRLPEQFTAAMQDKINHLWTIQRDAALIDLKYPEEHLSGDVLSDSNMCAMAHEMVSDNDLNNAVDTAQAAYNLSGKCVKHSGKTANDKIPEKQAYIRQNKINKKVIASLVKTIVQAGTINKDWIFINHSKNTIKTELAKLIRYPLSFPEGELDAKVEALLVSINALCLSDTQQISTRVADGLADLIEYPLTPEAIKHAKIDYLLNAIKQVHASVVTQEMQMDMLKAGLAPIMKYSLTTREVSDIRDIASANLAENMAEISSLTLDKKTGKIKDIVLSDDALAEAELESLLQAEKLSFVVKDRASETMEKKLASFNHYKENVSSNESTVKLKTFKRLTSSDVQELPENCGVEAWFGIVAQNSLKEILEFETRFSAVQNYLDIVARRAPQNSKLYIRTLEECNELNRQKHQLYQELSDRIVQMAPNQWTRGTEVLELNSTYMGYNDLQLSANILVEPIERTDDPGKYDFRLTMKLEHSTSPPNITSSALDLMHETMEVTQPQVNDAKNKAIIVASMLEVGQELDNPTADKSSLKPIAKPIARPIDSMSSMYITVPSQSGTFELAGALLRTQNEKRKALLLQEALVKQNYAQLTAQTDEEQRNLQQHCTMLTEADKPIEQHASMLIKQTAAYAEKLLIASLDASIIQKLNSNQTHPWKFVAKDALVPAQIRSIERTAGHQLTKEEVSNVVDLAIKEATASNAIKGVIYDKEGGSGYILLPDHQMIDIERNAILRAEMASDIKDIEGETAVAVFKAYDDHTKLDTGKAMVALWRQSSHYHKDGQEALTKADVDKGLDVWIDQVQPNLGASLSKLSQRLDAVERMLDLVERRRTDADSILVATVRAEYDATKQLQNDFYQNIADKMAQIATRTWDNNAQVKEMVLEDMGIIISMQHGDQAYLDNLNLSKKDDADAASGQYVCLKLSLTNMKPQSIIKQLKAKIKSQEALASADANATNIQGDDHDNKETIVYSQAVPLEAQHVPAQKKSAMKSTMMTTPARRSISVRWDEPNALPNKNVGLQPPKTSNTLQDYFVLDDDGRPINLLNATKEMHRYKAVQKRNDVLRRQSDDDKQKSHDDLMSAFMKKSETNDAEIKKEDKPASLPAAKNKKLKIPQLTFSEQIKRRENLITASWDIAERAQYLSSQLYTHLLQLLQRDAAAIDDAETDTDATIIHHAPDAAAIDDAETDTDATIIHHAPDAAAIDDAETDTDATQSDEAELREFVKQRHAGQEEQKTKERNHAHNETVIAAYQDMQTEELKVIDAAENVLTTSLPTMSHDAAVDAWLDIYDQFAVRIERNIELFWETAVSKTVKVSLEEVKGIYDAADRLGVVKQLFMEKVESIIRR